MRTQVRAGSRTEAGVALRFTAPQRDAILSVAELMRSLSIGAAEFETQVGGSREDIERIESRLRQSADDAEIDLTMTEVHLIHAALMASHNQFAGEEDFYVRIGFFRENIAGLARGIVRAVGQLST
ncbi:hypothetical protein ACN27B_29045 [Micromonospora sp. WMMD754]|uniref:hypothetical protein n=1 Tax=Micromonospora sp. WMMD754 TaxID=3404114 RepID=UPI003BF4E9AC